MRKVNCTLRLAAIFIVGIIAVIFTAAPRGVLAETTDFLTYSNTDNDEKVTVDVGESFSLQIKITSPVSYIGILPKNNSKNSLMEISVYRWVENRDKSMEGEAICKTSAAEWKGREIEIGLDFNETALKTLEPGEYLIDYKLIEGKALELTKYRMSRKGIGTYINGYFKYGAFHGSVRTAEAVSDPFGYISDQENLVLHTAGPEYVFPEDSAVVQMGVDPTTWTAVDGLGRTVSGYTDVGKSKNKKVGMFYWTWHEETGRGHKPCNVQAVMDEYPEAKNDYYHEVWKQYDNCSFFWNEPIYGFYMENDDYVLRKHAELLADAGVDFVLFDCTNGDYTWQAQYMNLLKVWSQAREEGVRTPQVAFMMQFGPSENTTSSIRQVYNALYRDGLYQDLWFYWEGKPLIMAYDSTLLEDDMLEQEMKNFFTFRYGVASYFEGDMYDNYWGWLHVYPQSVYKNTDKTVEMTTVGVSQNSNYVTKECSAQNGPYNTGRSYTGQENFSYTYKYRGQTVTVNRNIEHSEYYGLNYQEQWDYAIAQNPEIIFITGWNEWTAGRNKSWGGVDNGFPDEFDDENSRDIEPTKGRLKDHYYYQTVENIRRFKGVSKPKAQTSAKAIDIDGDFSQWDSASIITYNHYINNTYERDGYGYGDIRYTGDAIRNDFQTMKVSYDRENIYFYCKTVSDISSPSDDLWMRLLIDTGAASAASADWEGFEYILNRTSPENGLMTLERSTGGWNWETVGSVRYAISGNEMMAAIPRSFLGFGSDSSVDFGFKWCDNNLTDGDIITLYTDGDAAPGGRFTFHFFDTPIKDGKGGIGVIGVIGLIAAIGVIGVIAVLGIRRRGKV